MTVRALSLKAHVTHGVVPVVTVTSASRACTVLPQVQSRETLHVWLAGQHRPAARHPSGADGPVSESGRESPSGRSAAWADPPLTQNHRHLT
ncbi:MAG: hypothetical protein NVS3B26_23930 [Mycobacteriales bacterium]